MSFLVPRKIRIAFFVLAVAAALLPAPAMAQYDIYPVVEVPVGPVAPGSGLICRAYDSRGQDAVLTEPSGPLDPGVTYTIRLDNICDLPASADGVVISVAVLGAAKAGDLTVFPAGTSMPALSPQANALSFSPDPISGQPRNRAKDYLVPFGTNGSISFRAEIASSGQYHVKIDIVGFFTNTVILDDAATVNQDAAATPIDVLANDSDPDDTLEIASFGDADPPIGTVVLTPPGGPFTGLTYTPAPGYCNNPPGTTKDTFDYTVLGLRATVSVTVNCLSVAVDDTYGTAIDTTLNVNAASGVTTNDTLNGGAIVSYGATTGAEQTTLGVATPTAQGGSITLNADGSFTYVPPTGYLGDDTFKYVLQNAGGNSTATVTITVSKNTQTIEFTSTAPVGAVVGGPTYTVTATATSGLPVTFTIDASASTVCSIAGSTVSFIGTGTCVINANQPGDANYAPAPQVQQSFPVGQASQTISFTSSPPATPTVGGPTYTVTATATSGLPVTFTIDASASTVCSIAGSTVSFIGNGTCVINADQAGDANYSPAPQVQQSFGVKTAQTISFTSSPPATPTVGGATYTVTATATSGLPVTFTIDASASTVCTIAGSTVSFIGNGTCVINADQAGDANYYPAPQVQQSFEVKTGQTISFTSSPPATPTVGGPTYTATATATSGLPVTFTIDASASTVCTIAGSTVSFIGNGTCVINANQAGDATYHAAPQVQQSFGVKTTQTISFTSSPPATPTVGGATYTVTATATSGLPVTFTIDASASTVCTISGSTVSFIGNGTCVINANQAGDANYYAAPQVQQSFGVKTAQTISFTSSPPATPTVGGATYTVTAMATSGLPVTFTIDASASTVCTISGSTVSFIGNGTCVINADQAGDADYYPAPQVQQSFGVKTAQTISFTSSPPATPTVGGATYTVTATATSGLPVAFTIDASASTVCSISGSTVSFIGNGTCVINANQAGDANYYPAPQVQQSFGVKTAQTISFTSSPPAMPTVGGATYTVTATATSGLPVTITIDASASTVCSISGSTVSFIGNGTCVINANQAGDANYYAAPQVQQSFSVKSLQTITFTSTPPSPAARIGGPTYAVTATATSGLPVTFTIDASASTVCTISGSTVSFIGGGTCVINANQAGDANYYPAPQVQQSFYVNFPPVIPTTATYTTPGNTQLHVAGATLAGVASWADATGLLSKSGASDPDNFPPPPTVNVVPASGTTANGGTYSIAANGSFTYVPAVGFTGTDSFNFQVTDTLDATTGTVNITVGQRVWYIHDVVDANNAAGGDGRSTNAFDSIAAFNAATTNDNDIIFVFRGNTGTTPHSGGLTLRNGQKLHGQGIGLTVPGFGSPLVAAGLKPRISNTSGDAVSVPATAGNRQNVEIRGLDLSGSVNAIDVTASGVNQVGVTISDNDIPSAGAEGIDLNAGSTGAFTATVSNNAIAATGNGFDARTSAATTMTVDFSNNAAVSNATAVLIDGAGGGTTTITGFANNAVSGVTGGTGISVNAARFDSTPGGTFQTVSGGITTVGSSGDRVGGAGVVMTNVSGDLSFTDLDIFAGQTGGAGLRASGTTAYTGSAGFQIAVGAGVSTVSANGGPAVDLTTVTAALPFQQITSTNSATTGVALNSVAGTVSAATGSSITGSTGTGFQVGSSSAAVTYNGTITTTAGKGVDLTSNPGTISFTGTLTLSSGSNTAFNATGGGTVTATDTASTLTSLTGTALNVSGTNIGAGGLKFRSISANGAASGIVLNNTGASGSLTVSGTGAAGSGGTIQNTTSHGISLTSTLSPSFNWMSIQSTAGSGVNGTQVTNFTFTNGTVNNSGTGLGAETSNIAFNTTAAGTENNLSGAVTITGNTLTNSYYHGIDIFNFNGTISDANISGNTITSSNSTASSKGSGIRFIAFGSATTVANVTKATIANNIVSNFPSAAGIMAQGGNGNASGPAGVFGTAGSGTNIIAITGNRVAGFSAANRIGTQAILAVVNGKGQGNFDVSSNGTVANPLTNTIGTTLALSSLGQAVVTAAVSNNVIVANNTAGANGIGAGTSQTFGSSDTPNLTVTISGNQISQTDGNGILVTARDATGTVRAKIQSNTVAAPLAGNRNGIRVDAGNAVSVNDTVCLNISGNTSAGVGLSPEGIGLRKQGTTAGTNNLALHGFATSPATQAQTAAYSTSQNPGSASGTLIISGDNFNSPTCSFP